MPSKKEYPPLADAIKSLDNAMTVFTRECAKGATWARLHTISDRILERRAVLEIVYKRTFPANQKPKNLAKLTTPELVAAAKSRLEFTRAKK
jgi:hypothetical protein